MCVFRYSYIHACVGFCVARFDRMGNAKASKSGTSNWYGNPHFFVSCTKQSINFQVTGWLLGEQLKTMHLLWKFISPTELEIKFQDHIFVLKGEVCSDNSAFFADATTIDRSKLSTEEKRSLKQLIANRTRNDLLKIIIE